MYYVSVFFNGVWCYYTAFVQNPPELNQQFLTRINKLYWGFWGLIGDIMVELNISKILLPSGLSISLWCRLANTAFVISASNMRVPITDSNYSHNWAIKKTKKVRGAAAFWSLEARDACKTCHFFRLFFDMHKNNYLCVFICSSVSRHHCQSRSCLISAPQLFSYWRGDCNRWTLS